MAMIGTGGTVPAAADVILAEARELRRKQDTRLRGLQALSRSMLAGFLSAGLIALASRPPGARVASEFSYAITCSALVLVGITVLVELSTNRWTEGPDIDALIDQAQGSSTAVLIETHLARMHDHDRKRNERSLARARRFVALQVYGTLGGGALLLAMLLEVR